MILEPREKIVFLRKKYKISQKELAGNSFTPANLSCIENGKIKLSEKKAKIIADNFNNIFERQEIIERVSIEWIFESVDSQINKKINELIIKLYKKENFIKIVKEAEKIFIKYSTPKYKVKFYFILGNYYLKNDELVKAKECYQSILDSALHIRESKILGCLLLQLLRINYYINQSIDSEFLFQNYFRKFKIASRELEGAILYNFALSFQCLEKYELSLRLYKTVHLYTIKESILNNIEINTSFCLQQTKKYSESITILKALIFKTSNDYIRMKAYCNIVSCARKSDDYMLCKTSLDKLNNLIEKFEKTYLFQTYFTLGLGYLYINKLDMAAIYFEKEIALGIDYNNNNFDPKKYLESIKCLLLLYTKKDMKKIKKLIIIILNIPKEMLNLDFVLFVIKKFDDSLLREETSKLINKFYNKIKEDTR